MVQKQKRRGRNSKWVTVSQDSAKKKEAESNERGGEKGKTESPCGQRPAHYSPDSNVRQREKRGCEVLHRSSAREKNNTPAGACFGLCHFEVRHTEKSVCMFNYQSSPFDGCHVTQFC